MGGMFSSAELRKLLKNLWFLNIKLVYSGQTNFMLISIDILYNSWKEINFIQFIDIGDQLTTCCSVV